MKKRSRILTVEDDRDLLELTGAILGQNNDVTCESSTAPALRQITAHPFDLLLTDLNIENAGDGLILAGAMRYLQPQARTVLITGYPDFTRALLAMQASLDLVLLKPVEIETIRELPRQTAAATAKPREPGHTSLWALIERQKTDILSAWLHLVEQDAELARVPLSPAQRLDHMDEILTSLVTRGSRPEAAAEHGRARLAQNYRAEWVAKDMSFLRRVIFDFALRELLQLDLSALTTQIFEMNSALDADLLSSLRSFGLLAA